MKTTEHNMRGASVSRSGFTLIEVLASMAVLVVLMLILLRIFNEASGVFMRGNNVVLRTSAARSALDMIRRDIEGAVIDSRLALFKEAGTYDANFDRICMVTMGGDPNDGRAYQLVQYYVTSISGLGYTNFSLIRASMDFDTALSKGVDPFDVSVDWWTHSIGNGYVSEVMLDNVVRFDLWACEVDGDNIDQGVSVAVFGGNAPYNSRLTNVPPAYIDVYLQVTSDATMKRAGMMLSRQGGGVEDELRRKGYSMLYQDSNVLMERIVPIMFNAERLHPLSY